MKTFFDTLKNFYDLENITLDTSYNDYVIDDYSDIFFLMLARQKYQDSMNK